MHCRVFAAGCTRGEHIFLHTSLNAAVRPFRSARRKSVPKKLEGSSCCVFSTFLVIVFCRFCCCCSVCCSCCCACYCRACCCRVRASFLVFGSCSCAPKWKLHAARASWKGATLPGHTSGAAKKFLALGLKRLTLTLSSPSGK